MSASLLWKEKDENKGGIIDIPCEVEREIIIGLLFPTTSKKKKEKDHITRNYLEVFGQPMITIFPLFYS